LPQEAFISALQRRPRAWVLGFTAAVLLAVSTLVGFDLWTRYSHTLDGGKGRARGQAYVLGEYLRGSFDVADTVLRQLVAQGTQVGGPEGPTAQWDGLLNAARSAMPIGRAGSISVADSNGVIRQSTMKALVGESRSDQFIFKHLSKSNRDELVMDAPFLVGRDSGKRYVLPIGRRLTGSDGRFAGVVVTVFEVDKFLEFLDTVNVGRNGVISVFHPSGVLIFRAPGGARNIGQSAEGDPIWRASRDKPGSGFVSGPLSAGGAPHVSAYQTLSAPPLVVSVSLSRTEILADWRTQLRTALLALGALTMALSAIVLVLFRQMSARERVETELRRLQDDEANRLRGANEQLEAALEREQRARRDAEAASRLKDEFLMTLSHELRTPLTAIFGWVRMLATKTLPEDDRTRAIGAIERNARAQTRLIDDLLDVSRAISGKLRLEPRILNVPDVVRSAIETIAPAVDAKNIRLDLQVQAGVEPIFADPDRVQQIVWNLLSNAIKFTPTGGTITLSVADAGEGVEILVSDSGIGINPEFVPYVFERFRQADAGSRRRFGGLGLGLAIVRHLVELHGGSVRADSGGEGRGATFRVMLPARAARRDSSPELPVASVILKRVDRSRLDRVRVLVVDDEADARDLFSSMLRGAGAVVTTAASAAEARHQLATNPPQVLVADIEMPEEDGYELMHAVRSGGGPAHLIAVAVTAYARDVDKRRALDAGFDWHLAKPVEPDDLISVIAALVTSASPVSPGV
jgi:signal transduction histidine kinase/ActR/RegA family two-component response regulator